MSINANTLAQSTPAVLAVGGSNLLLNGMFLTQNTRVPIGVALPFGSALAVAQFFGATSPEALIAPYYFNGFDNSAIKPATMYFAQMPYGGPVSAYLQGSPIANLTMRLNGLEVVTNGSLVVAIDGSTFNATGINLSSANSLTNVASILTTALVAVAPTTASFTGSITGTALTVSTVASGALAVGQAVSGGATANNTVITALGNGTGGVGTYTVTPSQTVASGGLTTKPQAPVVTFDSLSSSFILTSGSAGVASTVAPAQGSLSAMLQNAMSFNPTISQGAAVASGVAIPGFLSNLLVASGQTNFGGLTTVFEPTLNDKVQIAKWNNGQYVYAMWDSNVVPQSTPDTSSAGYLINQAGYSGTVPVGIDPNVAAFVLGSAASINFNQANGRYTLAYRSQAGLVPQVTSSQVAAAYIANGYSFYGAYANSSNSFVFLQNGAISGPFLWWDSYIGQIVLNNGIQTALIALMKAIGNIPYNYTGYTLISNALFSGVSNGNTGVTSSNSGPVGPIAQAVRFGTIRPGVVLSSTQLAAFTNALMPYVNNTAAAVNQLFAQGWYLLVADPGPTVREMRGSPIVLLYYTDGQSVQTIDASATAVL